MYEFRLFKGNSTKQFAIDNVRTIMTIVTFSNNTDVNIKPFNNQYQINNKTHQVPIKELGKILIFDHPIQSSLKEVMTFSNAFQ